MSLDPQPATIALQFFTGYGASHVRHFEAGMWDYCDKICEAVGPQRVCHKSVLPWDGDTKRASDKIRSSGATFIVTGGHSYGEGKGDQELCYWLAKLGLSVAVRVMVDPVIYFPWLKPASMAVAAFWPNSWKFKLSPNVGTYIHFRTVNDRLFTPWGARDILAPDGIECACSITVGTKDKLAKWKITSESLVGTDLHGSIDNNEYLQSVAAKVVTRRLGLAA